MRNSTFIAALAISMMPIMKDFKYSNYSLPNRPSSDTKRLNKKAIKSQNKSMKIK